MSTQFPPDGLDDGVGGARVPLVNAALLSHVQGDEAAGHAKEFVART